MSVLTRSIRDFELRTCCMAHHFLRSSSFCQSFSRRVFASNQASIFSSDPRCWSMSRASGTVAFVDEDEQLAHRAARTRLQLADELVELLVRLRAARLE